MASVYQATDTSLGRTVAVKLFRSDSMDAVGPERQSGEISLLASLNHFALVTLFDAGTAHVDGAPRTFIVMEFVDGADLRTRLLEGPVEQRELAGMGADLAEALHYVHALGIIHRDIKPANVLLGPSGFPGRAVHAKLADFGIARLLDETRLTATGATLGTASYLSPEQALGSVLGPPTDIYSLGLVLLESLTGERAYPGTAIESAMARLQRQPIIPPEVSRGWADLLTAMTSREAGDRPTASAAAVVLRTLVSESTPGLGSTTPLLNDLAAETGLATSLMAESADAPTRLLPEQPTESVPAPAAQPTPHTDNEEEDAATALLPRSDTPASGRTVRQKEPRKRASAVRPWTTRAIAIGAGVIVAVAVLLVVLLNRPGAPEAVPPSYPAVEGTLGTHLQELQESVNP